MKPKDAYEDGKCPDCWTPISDKAKFGDHCPNCNWTFAPTKNENCLAGMSCPKCGSKGPFRIVATCWALVCDDGIEDTTEHEWEDDAACICAHCKHDAKVLSFREEGRDVIHDGLTWEESLKEMEGDKSMLREMESALVIDINNAVTRSINVAKATGSALDASEGKALLSRLEDVQSRLKAMGEEVHPYDENATP